MGPQLEYLETILTCKGNFYAPDFSSHLDDLKCRLQELVLPDDSKKFVVKKVEPWNSVRVTLKMPANAAQKLKKLAEQRNRILHEIGVLEVQIEGDKVISLAIDGSKSEGLEQSSENGSKSESITKVPPCCSGQCVPSKETLKPFASLPQSANLEWPLFTKILSTVGDRSSVRVNIYNSSDDPQTQVICSKADHKSSVMNIVSSYQNSPNYLDSCNLTQNASSPPLEMAFPQANRSWVPGEEKLNCQNIASSSPLLVNLLKSPGSRTQPSSLSVRSHHSCGPLSEVALPAQKRRRSQTRKSKRLKEGTECTNVSNHSSFLGIPASHSTFQQDTVRTSLNVSNQTSISESRQMINPYTGDLEVIEECEEPSNSASSDVGSNFRESLLSESTLTKDINAHPSKTLELPCDISDMERHVSSHSTVVSSSLIDGVPRHSTLSDASSEFLRSNIETSTSTCFNPSIPVFSVQSQWNVNMNLPHTHFSPVPNSLPENGLLLNHALSSCYMQSMLKALTSENAKFFASQSLIFPTTVGQTVDESKPVVDVNPLARIIVQSSLLPKTLDAVKNTCLLSTDTKPGFYYSSSTFSNTNGQLPKQMACSSRPSAIPINVVPHDIRIQSHNNVALKEGIPLQLHKKLSGSQPFQKLNNTVTSPQASQLMKEMFPSLQFPVFSSTSSIPITCAIYNGHADASHQEQTSSKSLSSESVKSGIVSSTDCRTINGCYSSPLVQSTFLNDSHKSSIAPSVPLPLSANSSDCDGALLTSSFIASKSLPSRKPSKNLDDPLPTKSKANLTVAQLLEQVEIAKNHLALSSSLKNNTSEVPHLYMSSNVSSTKLCVGKSDQRNEMVSQIHKNALSSHCNLGHPQKLLAYSNHMPFNILDSIPLPITSPGYPHNLTESVQKAMQGVGFDNSPSTSPPPAVISQELDTSQHPQIDRNKVTDDKKSDRSLIFVSKGESVGIVDLDILENQFELGHLEEALKSSLKGGIGESCAEDQKHLIDLDSTDLDFVFNAEDENHLESLITLKDYDDIEKLAEKLASNIDDGDIDEEILISETLDHDGSVYKVPKSNSSLPSETPSESKPCTSLASDIININIASSLLGCQHSGERASKLNLSSESFDINLLDENSTKQTVIKTNADQIGPNNLDERIRCKNSKKLTLAMSSGSTEKRLEFGDEIASQSTFNRMATRSSNKQRCQTTANLISNLQNDARMESTASSDAQKNTVEETTLQPLLRRSNRTIKKTEIAVESLQTKSIERSKRTKDEGGGKLHCLPPNKTEHGARFRQKSGQKRKYTNKASSVNENVQNSNSDVPKDQALPKRVACNNSSTMSGPLESTIIETDFILCSKRPKTS